MEIYEVGIDHRTGADVHSKKSTVANTGYHDGRPTSVSHGENGTSYTYQLPASGYAPGMEGECH